MDKEAINAIIKGIKEGAQAMTPLAKEYVHQVQMRGIVESFIGILLIVIIAITSIFIFKIYKSGVFIEKSYYGNKQLNGVGAGIMMVYGGISVLLFTISIILIISGVGEAVAPLPSILGK